jgi:DNA-binding GntR family transcriptional regulator
MVKEALEVQAAMMFAERSTSRESAELIKLASRLDARAESQSTDALTWLDLHEKLHLKLAEFAHCDALYEAIRRQSALTSAWLGAMKATVLQERQPKHEPLMRTLARHKPGAAAESMRGHLHADRECTLRILEPCFEVNKKYVRTYSRTIRRKAADEPAPHAAESRSLGGAAPAHSPAA